LGGSGLANAADQAVERMMAFIPGQKGVAFTTPAAAELDKCKVDATRTADGKGTVWLLKDGKGSILRRFADTNADKYPDQWCVYKDGIEVYREVDSDFNGKTDKYVWLNSGGMKVGIDKQEKGTITNWQALSVEELSQEVLKALVRKDYKVLEAVLVNDDDLKAIGAPAAEIKRINELQKNGQAKFGQTATKLSQLNEKTNWLHVETGAPSRLPADTTGMKQDVLMHYRGLIFCETGGKSDFIQLGEIVLVGEAWKLIDAPLPGDADGGARPSALMNASAKVDGPSQEYLEKLAAIDAKAPKYEAGIGPNSAVATYQLQRAVVIEEIVAKAPAGEKDHWTKQLADSLSTAVQASPKGDTKAMEKLESLATQLAKDRAGSDLAAYVAYRGLACRYTKEVGETSSPKAMLELQNRHVERLAKFVADYPKSEDGADALLQLGMINEFQGKEDDAKKWYEQMTRQFASIPQSAKAAGALRRLNLEGKVWEVGAQAGTLTGTPAFNLANLRGKVTVVYYWATWCQTTQADFAKLKQLAQEHRSNLQIVCINVDDSQAQAEAFVKQHAAPGYHLYASGGLESPLATHYGLVVFPNVFLVGRDGKVVNRSLDTDELQEAIKKAAK
jgi:thiol-disulfide isomerase/thioredoxin